jgi:hypothetical protein
MIYYRSTRTAWLVTQWTEVPPTSGAHLFVVSGSVQIVYNRAKISASSEQHVRAVLSRFASLSVPHLQP